MKKHFLRLWCLAFWLYAVPLHAVTFDHEHGLLDILLKKHVIMSADKTSSRVDYQALAKDRGLMKAYLSAISSVSQEEFDRWNRKEQLAFLINAYNAYTLDLVVRHYPVQSVRNIGSFFRKTWSIRFADLLGQKRTLDEIEHGMIRKKGVYGEPRVHAALAFAAVGSPALRNEVYTAEKLDGQLEQAMKLFLLDRTRNRFDAHLRTFHVSALFHWKGDDFKAKFGSLGNLFITYAGALALSEDDVAAIKKEGTIIEFENFDWSLNDR